MDRRKVARVALLSVPAALAATTFGAWLSFRPPWRSPTLGALAGSVGDLLALLGLIGLGAMVTTGTRFPWVERTFGLDRVYRFHQPLGVAVFSTFVAHALLRTLRISLQHGGGWEWSFLFYAGTADPALLLGHVALYALILLISLAALGRRRIPFRPWKSMHLIVYGVVALAFAHAWLKGSAELMQAPNLAVFAVLAAVVLVACAYRLHYSIGRDRRRTWRVDHLVTETHDTTTLVVSRREGPGPFARRRAGQFAIIRVRRGNRWSEPHPFTISAPPGTEELQFTIKAGGRFTSAIPSLAPGTPVLCEGPYGVFTLEPDRETEIVMISGGVGVTPFLSHIRHARRIAPGARIVLLCANKSPADIIARDELAAVAAATELRVVHILSQTEPDALPEGAPGVTFESGRVSEDLMARHVPSADASFYFCGPPPMQSAVLHGLEQRHGVRPSRVHRELFFY